MFVGAYISNASYGSQPFDKTFRRLCQDPTCDKNLDPDSTIIHLDVWPGSMKITVGVLALQGAFFEHLVLLRKAALQSQAYEKISKAPVEFEFIEIRKAGELSQCDALIIPGGESTTISLVAAQSSLIEPLRNFVKSAFRSRKSLNQ